MNRIFVLMTAVFTAAALSAENTYQWENTTDRTAAATTAGNWSGQAPTSEAAGQLDDLFLFYGDLPFCQTIGSYNGTKSGYDYYYGTIQGDASHVIAGPCNGLTSRAAYVKDASGFAGSIGAQSDETTGGADWFLCSTIEQPAVVQNARLMFGLGLNVYQIPGATGVVEHAWGPGLWSVGTAAYSDSLKTSDAVIEVDDLQSGPQSSVVVANRNHLHIKGGYVESPRVVGTPSVHLDATESGSFVWTDGRITAWRDVRGTGFAAVADGRNPGPVITADADSGLPFVDFGKMSDIVERKWGTSVDAATLVFQNGALEGIREVFIVFKDQPVDVLPNNERLFVQNFLGSAAGTDQYFSRWMVRRSGLGFYRTYLLDANTMITSSGGNYSRDPNAATKQNVTADVRINGARVMPEYTDDFSRYANILSIGYAGDASPVRADRLACNGSGRIGGIQIGELIVYTTALTPSQRREVNAYLLKKWGGKSHRSDCDLAAVSTGAGSEVKAVGGTLSVGVLDVDDESMEMEGNLRVESFAGGTPSIVFGKGASNLTLAASAEATNLTVPSAPVSHPEIWLDANRNVTTFATNCFGESITYVSKWEGAFENGVNRWGFGVSASRLGFASSHDERYCVDSETGLLLPKGTAIYPCYPTLADAGYGNLKMIDFGPQRRDVFNTVVAVNNQGIVSNLVDGTQVTNCKQVYDWRWKRARDGSAFSISRVDKGAGRPIDTAATRTAFYVLRLNDGADDNAQWPITFGTRICCAGNRRLLTPAACSGDFRGAEWRVNGAIVNPFSFEIENGRTYVVSVRTVEPQSYFSYLCYYPAGNGSGSWGGVSYGELIAYPHRLTDREVVENEAYLMNRWLGEEHPMVADAAGAAVDSVVFSDPAVSASVTAEKTLALGSLTVAGTSFAKRGAGEMNVTSSSENISSFTVDGGSLATKQNWLADACLHLDASDYDSFTWKEGLSGSSIVTWQDVRRNGKVATSRTAPIDDPMEHIGTSNYRNYNSGMTNAQYRVSDGSDGLVAGMGYVDCLSNRSAKYYNKDTGAPCGSAGVNMAILSASNDCAGLTFTPISNAREFHLVWAFNDAVSQVLPVGDTGSTLIPTGDDGSSAIFNALHSSVAAKSKIKMDGGDWLTGRYSSDNKYKVGTSYHVQTIVFPDNVTAAQLVMDRANCARGGMRLCEVIIFAGETNTTARAEQIHAYLRKKWLDSGEGAVAGSEIESVDLANGGVLSLDNDVVLKDGAVITASVTETDVSSFTVGGKLTIGDGAKLIVELDESMGKAEGEWILLSAAEIAGSENLSVVLSGAPSAAVRAKTSWKNGVLVLKMSRPGMSIIVR